jgi:hypothetical protein
MVELAELEGNAAERWWLAQREQPRLLFCDFPWQVTGRFCALQQDEVLRGPRQQWGCFGPPEGPYGGSGSPSGRSSYSGGFRQRRGGIQPSLHAAASHMRRLCDVSRAFADRRWNFCEGVIDSTHFSPIRACDVLAGFA